MSNIQTGHYKNSNGKTVSGKLWFIGENECKLTKVGLRTARNGKHFIVVELQRDPEHIPDRKTKATFVPHTDVLFEEGLKDFCAAFGHELKERPPDMDFNVYMRHVYRRVDTFVGKRIKVSVWLSKEARKDDYGEQVIRNVRYDLQEEVHDWRMNMLYNTKKDFDYRSQSVIFAKEYNY